MKKYTMIIALVWACMLTGCDKKDSDDTGVEQQVSEFSAGQIVNKEFAIDGQVVVSMESEIVNFGTKEAPALFSIFRENKKMTEGYEEVFFPLYRDRLERFIVKWRELNVAAIGDGAMYSGRAYQHLLNFLLNNKLDPGLLLRVIEEQSGSEQAVVQMLQAAGDAVMTRGYDETAGANDILVWLYKSKAPASAVVKAIEAQGMTVDDFLGGMYERNGDFSLLTAQTRGKIPVGNIVAIIKSVKKTIDMWTDFVKNNGPVVDVEDNYISFVNESDTIPANYKGGKYHKSKTYSVAYNVSKIWYARAEYYVEVTYGAKHPDIDGLYITRCNVISTKAEAGGPKFSVKGRVNYSPADNKGAFENPIALISGDVCIDYGDCCCCHYFSYLNFIVAADTGYEERSFSTGRN